MWVHSLFVKSYACRNTRYLKEYWCWCLVFFFKHSSFIHYRMFTKFIVQYFHIMKYCEWHMPLCMYHHYLIDTFSWMDKSVFCKHNHSSKVNPLTQTRQRNYFNSFHSTMESFLWKDLQMYPTDEPSLRFWETQRHFKDNEIHQFLRNIWWLKFHSLLHFFASFYPYVSVALRIHQVSFFGQWIVTSGETHS